MIDKTTVVRKTSGQVSCRINDDVAILDTNKSLYFRLEDIAVQVWEALDNPSSVAELRDAIVARFDVPAAQCEADILDLLCQLEAKGLVEAAS